MSDTSKRTHLRLQITRAHVFALCCVLGGAALGAMSYKSVSAGQDAIDGQLILPYDGVLMIDGVPFSGTRAIQFDLYTSPDATATPVWSETLGAVSIYGGRFSVGLGTSTPLTSQLLEAEKLYLGLTIEERSMGGTVLATLPLEGRQIIEPAPFAALVGYSSTFSPAGHVTVEGGATLNGGLTTQSDAVIQGATGSTPLTIHTAGTTQQMILDGSGIDSNGPLFFQNNLSLGTRSYGDLSVLGDTTIGSAAYNDINRVKGVPGSASAGALQIDTASNNTMYLSGTGIDSLSTRWLNFTGSEVRAMSDMRLGGAYKPSAEAWTANTHVGEGGAAIVNDTSNYKALMITGSTTVANGARNLLLQDDVYVNDHLEVQGSFQPDSLSVTTSLTASGTVSHSTLTCPGSPWAQAENTSMKSKLCVYKLGLGSNPDYNDAADGCWTSYGAELCTINQMRIGLTYGGGNLSTTNQVTNNRVMRDFFNDGVVARVATVTSETDFDESVGKTTGLSGGYCCLMLSGY